MAQSEDSLTRSPAENQQTVEASLRAGRAALEREGKTIGTGTFTALSDLGSQASRTREWKQLAEDMGEALARARTAREVDALLARLHDLSAEQDAA